MPASGLETIVTRIRERFDAAERARERCLALHRELIRTAGTAIRAVHRHHFDEARRLLERGRALRDELAEPLAQQPQLLHTGYVQDAHKEYAEAWLTLALVRGEELPSPEALGVEDASYLNGLGEAVGEVRRFLLDLLRRDEPAPVEDLMDTMDDVYAVLTTMDYPDALTRGLRRTTDVARGIVEKTRGDLTHYQMTRDLDARLQRTLAALCADAEGQQREPRPSRP